MAAKKKYPLKQYCFFTISGKKGSAKITELEEVLTEENIFFMSLLKDETDTKVFDKINLLIKQWTAYNLSVGIPQHNKNRFFNGIVNNHFTDSIIIFDEFRDLNYLLLYWRCNKKEVSITSVLHEFPNCFYDLPNISYGKLFNNIGLSKVEYPLISYYQIFYDTYSDNLDELLKKTKNYLRELASIKKLEELKEINSPNFNKNTKSNAHEELKIIRDRLKDEKINIQGHLENPLIESTMIQFQRRLWFRLFCVGAYFMGFSKLVIYLLLATDNTFKTVQTTDDNLKVFSKSLWIDGFSQKTEHWERDYQKIWFSLTKYEKDFIINWWSEVLELKENDYKELFRINDLDKVTKYIS